MAFSVQPGDCFWLNYGGALPHFFFVISAPDQHPDKPVILVSMTSVSPDKNVDNSCLLSEGDHATCNRPSFIDYRHALKISSAELERLVDAGNARHRPPPLQPDILERLRDGAELSDFLRNEVRAELWQQGILRP